MKILLIDADLVFPNLALMQLSTYFKEKGHRVDLGSSNNPDEVYVSCVFPENREKALMSSTYYPDADIHFGGTGFNLTSKIPVEAQHKKPDYSLYDGKLCVRCYHLAENCTCRKNPRRGDVDFSLGFTSRGCIRKCGFCIVPKKEGWIREHSTFEEFLEPSFDKIFLLDNNFLASPKYIEKLKHLIKIDKKVCFNQGLDIRLVDDENVELLARVNSRDMKFRHIKYYFAWDLPEIERSVIRGLNKLFDAGIKPRHLRFYVLMSYNTNYSQDKHRLEKLIELGVEPYVMLYNNEKGTYQKHMQRWINGRFYRVVPWVDYDHGDSQKIIKSLETA